MRRITLILAFLTLTGVASGEAHMKVTVSLGVFYSSLDPHGEWIHVGSGSYAWRPIGVVHGWRPYTVGQWVWTDDGWYWVSEEPWGWATYHYGRWYHDEYYGWIWIPGYDWAPAWVEWRYSGDFIGWAPLGPYAVFSVGFGVHYPRYWVTPHYYWSFVSCRYVTHRNVHRYVYRAEDNRRYIGRTRYSGNVRHEGGRIIADGPERSYVEQHGKIRVARVDVVDTRDRGVERIAHPDKGKERIEVYRPRIDDRSVDVERPQKVRSTTRKVLPDVDRPDVRRRAPERGKANDAQHDRRPSQSGPELKREPRKEDHGPPARRAPEGRGNEELLRQQQSRLGADYTQPGRINSRSTGSVVPLAKRSEARSPEPERLVRRSGADEPVRESHSKGYEKK